MFVRKVISDSLKPGLLFVFLRWPHFDSNRVHPSGAFLGEIEKETAKFQEPEETNHSS